MKHKVPCAMCDEISLPTIDHIIPKWIFKKRFVLLKKKAKKYSVCPKQLLCADCNSIKGGSIDVSHPDALSFWLDVREEINLAVNKHFS